MSSSLDDDWLCSNLVAFAEAPGDNHPSESVPAAKPTTRDYNPQSVKTHACTDPHHGTSYLGSSG